MAAEFASPAEPERRWKANNVDSFHYHPVAYAG
jgi:hypothetical protein